VRNEKRANIDGGHALGNFVLKLIGRRNHWPTTAIMFRRQEPYTFRRNYYCLRKFPKSNSYRDVIVRTFGPKVRTRHTCARTRRASLAERSTRKIRVYRNYGLAIKPKFKYRSADIAGERNADIGLIYSGHFTAQFVVK